MTTQLGIYSRRRLAVVLSLAASSLQAAYAKDLKYLGNKGPFGLCQGDCDDDDDCEGKLVCFQRSGDKNDVPGCDDGAEGVFADVDYCISLDPIVSDEPDENEDEDEDEDGQLQDAMQQPVQVNPNLIGVMGETSTCVEGFGCLEYIAQGKEDNSGRTFGHCQGHCFSGSDCSGELKCVLRETNGDKFESVLRKFGCAGDLHAGSNYCVDSSKKLEGFDLITFEEATAPTTARPTWAPTRMPVVPTVSPTSQPTPKGPTRKPTARPTEAPTQAADARNFARRWTDVMTADVLDQTVEQDVTHQPVKVNQMYFAAQVAGETNPFRFTEAPTGVPTTSPTMAPYNPYPYNLPPEMPEPGYFDYSVRDGSEYDSGKGPDMWGRLPDGIATREGAYWSQFDMYIKHDIVTNKCASKSSRQSPIDVTNKIATKQCFEFHQIRHKDGNFPASDPKLEKQILPSKLRLHFPRDGFTDGSESFRDQDGWEKGQFGPSADMPKRWGYQLPVTHVDIKFPSEHYMDGKQYPMEYQINMIQNRIEKRRGAPVVSVLFDIHPEDKPNNHMEILIKEFEKVYEKDLKECEATQRRQRKLEAKVFDMLAKDEDKAAFSTLLDEPEEVGNIFESNLRAFRRRAQEGRTWDPWHESILKSFWFYGYEGSLTEPPCSEFVEWRIMLEPALISKGQLERLKNVLFNHVDENCKRTSVHSEEHGVARPLQEFNDHSVYTCTCLDYMDDDSKDAGYRKCRFRDRAEYGFDEDIYTYEWYQATHQWESIEAYWDANGGEPWWA